MRPDGTVSPARPPPDGRSWRASARAARPLLPAGLLGVVAVVVGGLLGFLIGFLAVLILMDRLLDRLLRRPELGMHEAEHTFARLTHERARASLQRRLRREPPEAERLRHLAEDAGWAATAARRRVGVMPIPVAAIVGTVDEHKAVAFDRAFRPPPFTRGRWTLMFAAVRRGAQLPPIAVVKAGDAYYVRDGHHRVSVARAQGGEWIDADVVELLPGATRAAERGDLRR